MLMVVFNVTILIITQHVTHAQTLKEHFSSKQSVNCFLSDTAMIKFHHKNPFLAGSLSFILPGLAAGQFYNEEYLKFAVHAGISGICFLLFMHNFDVGGSGNGTVSGLSFIAYTFNWVFTIVDAVASANRINDEIEKQRKGSTLNRFNMGLTLDKDKRVRIKFSLGI